MLSPHGTGADAVKPHLPIKYYWILFMALDRLILHKKSAYVYCYMLIANEFNAFDDL